jgi:REP element-mobilizing transposase RayT
MGHPLRWYLPKVVYEMTSRTIQERFLLRPDTQVRILVLGVMARGKLLYPAVHIHAFAFLSNHYHLLASAEDGQQLALFIGYINGNIGREIGAIHAWRGPFWGRRARAIPILDDEAMVARLRYVLSQGVKEGLVDRPEQWPGATSTPWLLGGELEGTWIFRDVERRARRRPVAPDPSTYTSQYALELTPLPCWQGLTRDEIATRTRRMIEEIVIEAAADRRGAPAAGVAQVLAQHPHDRPAERDSSRAPSCHGSSPGIRAAFRASYANFSNAVRLVADASRAAKRSVMSAFPPGCFPPPLPYIGDETPIPPWYLDPLLGLASSFEPPTRLLEMPRTQSPSPPQSPPPRSQ